MADAIQNTSGPTGEPIPNREPEALNYRQGEAVRADGRDLEPLRNRNNGEETSIRNPETGALSYAANSTKGMPHDKEFGEVIGRPQTGPFVQLQATAYDALLRAVNTENPADFAAVPIGPNPVPQGSGDPAPPPTRPFVDPQNGLSLAIEGPDAPSAGVYRGALNADGTLKPEPIAVAPAFPEAQLAADVGEVYLMALSRDVPVNRLHEGAPNDDFRVTDALELVNQFTDYRGPAVTNDLTGEVSVPKQFLFRGGNVLSERGSSKNVGELDGPYLSQFMIIGSRVDGEFPPTLTGGIGDKRQAGTAATGISLSRDQGQVLYGTLTIDQKQFEVQPDVDFVTDYDTWLQILQGVRPEDLANKNDQSSRYTGDRKFLYSLRQMAEYVHRDQTYQEGLIAALLIISMNERAERTGQSLFNDGNAYLKVANQTGFGSFGNGHVLALLAEATTRAIKAAWTQKWINQRRLRPEVLGGRIHNTVTGLVKESRYDLNPEITGLGTGPNRNVGQEIMRRIAAHNALQNGANGRPQKGNSFLLPQQYPEGSPTHPSYPAGHATQIAAEVTVLKGLFNEDFEITDGLTTQIDPNLDYALVPSNDGSALEIYKGEDANEPLTLGGELNKLAANVSLARSLAGVHYRLDYSESMLLGEYVGLGILQEQARQFNQARRPALAGVNGPFFFELTLFSGIKVRVLSTGEIVVV